MIYRRLNINLTQYCSIIDINIYNKRYQFHSDYSTHSLIPIKILLTLLYKPLLTQISNESVKRTSSNLQGFWLFLYLRRRKVLHLDIHYFNKETHFFIFRMPEPKSSTQPNSRSNFTKRVFWIHFIQSKYPTIMDLSRWSHLQNY